MIKIRSSTLLRVSMGFLLALCCLLAGCAINPVTGEQELSLISTAQEVAIGTQQYAPSQQSQGGPYELEPALSEYVSRIGERLARVSDRPTLPYQFVILNNDIPNAWALPGGKIAVNRGLLLHLRDEAELAAVLSHEIVHAAARHGAQQMEQGMLLGAGLQILGAATNATGYHDVILQGAGLGAALIQTQYSRQAELEADLHGMRYMSKAGYDPAAAIDLQQTFVELAKGSEGNWLAGMFASHPPSSARVEANRRTAASLPGGGRRGSLEYEQQLSKLRHDQPAYEEYAQAINSFDQERYPLALEQIDRSIARQPAQGLFHELRGMVLKNLKRPKDALSAFTRAIELNPSYFRHYLLRGFHLREMKQNSRAERDLIAANGLLPTAQASFVLGELRQEAGDVSGAANYYRSVAQSNSPLAPVARERLQRLSAETP